MFKEVLRRMFAFAVAAHKCIQEIDEALRVLPTIPDPVPGDTVGPDDKFDQAALEQLQEAKLLIASVTELRADNPAETLYRAEQLLSAADKEAIKRGVSLDAATAHLRTMRRAAATR